MSRSSCSRTGCISLIIVLFLVAVVQETRGYFNGRKYFPEAHQYYVQGECEQAIELYAKVDDTCLFCFGGFAELARPEEAECWSFQPGADKEAEHDPGGAVLAYGDFVQNHSESPLAPIALERIESAFLRSDLRELSSMALCDQLENLEAQDLIPQKRTTLPQLLYECGRTYAQADLNYAAIEVYDRFLADYPAHALADDVEDSLARAILYDARESGAGTIPAPDVSGETEEGSTVVVIQNDSPERLRLVFSGPDTRIEELAACRECTTYSYVGPFACPEEAPVGRYTLPPGRYDVVVEAISDTSVTPWTGDWDLASGDEYSSCFYITETWSP